MPLERISVPCVACKAPVSVDLHLPPRIMNMRSACFGIVEHSGQTACPQCGAVLIPVLGAIQNFVMGSVVVPPQERNLVVPVGGNGGRIV